MAAHVTPDLWLNLSGCRTLFLGQYSFCILLGVVGYIPRWFSGLDGRVTSSSHTHNRFMAVLILSRITRVSWYHRKVKPIGLY